MQQKMTRRSITETMHLALVDSEGTLPLEASFEYHPADPYAMTMTFFEGSATITWTFARDLLIDGFFEPAGDGDVHVFPCLSSEGVAVVIIDLESPHGQALIQVDCREVASFIDRMLTAVPQGSEYTESDLDAACRELSEVLGT
jgi:hypothetical protein